MERDCVTCDGMRDEDEMQDGAEKQKMAHEAPFRGNRSIVGYITLASFSSCSCMDRSEPTPQ